MKMTYDPKDLRVSLGGVDIPMGEISFVDYKPTHIRTVLKQHQYECSGTLTIEGDDATRLAMWAGWHVPWYTRLSLWFRGLFK